MELGLRKKRALVVSSSSGLGLAVARSLWNEGAQVLICGRRQDKLDDQIKLWDEQEKGRGFAQTVDLADKDSVSLLIETAQNKMGGIDILINNSGGPKPGSAAHMSLDQMHEQFQVMVARLIELSQKALPQMRERKWGRIITLASSGVQQPIANLALSNTLRASLVGWSKTLASEVATDGVTVNCVLPGRIHTSRLDELDAANAERQGVSREEITKRMQSLIPAKRYGRVEEFADAVTFLASEKASYITGILLRVDGGMLQSH